VEIFGFVCYMGWVSSFFLNFCTLTIYPIVSLIYLCAGLCFNRPSSEPLLPENQHQEEIVSFSSVLQSALTFVCGPVSRVRKVSSQKYFAFAFVIWLLQFGVVAASAVVFIYESIKNGFFQAIWTGYYHNPECTICALNSHPSSPFVQPSPPPLTAQIVLPVIFLFFIIVYYSLEQTCIQQAKPVKADKLKSIPIHVAGDLNASAAELADIPSPLTALSLQARVDEIVQLCVAATSLRFRLTRAFFILLAPAPLLFLPWFLHSEAKDCGPNCNFSWGSVAATDFAYLSYCVSVYFLTGMILLTSHYLMRQMAVGWGGGAARSHSADCAVAARQSQFRLFQSGQSPKACPAFES
jgi:hypothetical protein